MRRDNPGFVPDSIFSRDLPREWLNFFSFFPKAELHCHLLGTISESTFRDLVHLSGASVTDEEITGFYTRGDKPVGVLRIFRALESQILCEPAYLYRITMEHIQRVSVQGVRYLELFWNWTGLEHFMTYESAQSAIVQAMQDAEELYAVKTRLIPSIDREDTPEAAVKLVQEMIAHSNPYVIGLGIDYRETAHEPENFWKAYQLAREAGFKVTAHAGEFGEHWRNVETAMDLLRVDRIDHGYTIIDNLDLVRRAKEKNVIFSVVPTNSYYLRTFTDEEWAYKQPIRQMVKMGLRVFPNSDDPTMHQVSISQAWRLMFDFLGFELPQLREFLINSIDAAWVDEEQKSQWKRDWCAQFDQMAAQLPLLPARREQP